MHYLMDCDAGADDALALRLLLQSGLPLLGVSTCFGGFPAETAAIQAQGILHPAAIPLCAGARRAGSRNRGPVHREQPTSWAGPSLPPGEFLADCLATAKGPVALLATGPLSNVAAMLACAPRLPDRIVLMGGGLTRGNRTEFAEFNFWCDPEAADQVLRSGLPITLLPLEGAAACALSEQELASLPPALQGGAEAQLAFARGCGFSHQVILYDLIAAAGLIAPEVFKKTKFCHCRVDCSPGPKEGALILTEEPGPVELVLETDKTRFLQFLSQVFSEHKEK